MSQQENQPEYNEDDSSSAIGSICTICNGNELNELKLKMADLEVKNLMATNKHLEDRLKHLEEKFKFLEEKQSQEKKYVELETKMRDKSMERKLQESQAKIEEIYQKTVYQKIEHQKEIHHLEATLEQKLKATEDKAEMAKNELESIIKAVQQKVEECAKEMAIQNAKYEKLIQPLEEKNELLVNMAKDTALKDKSEKNESTSSTVEQAKEAAGTILTIPQVTNEFGNEMAIQKKGEQEKQGNSSDPIKPDILSTHLIKGKRLVNPQGKNGWNGTNTKATISEDGLQANYDGWYESIHVFALQGFPISAEHCPVDYFNGTIVYFFEITKTSYCSWELSIGLSTGPDCKYVGHAPYSYAMENDKDYCNLSGVRHDFEWPNEATKPKWNRVLDVYGCGLLLSSKNKLAIFFTVNGILMGKQIPISPSVDRLFPTLYIPRVSIEANFGEDPAKPFKYDVDKCPGLVFE